jgi:hypothetical protein
MTAPLIESGTQRMKRRALEASTITVTKPSIFSPVGAAQAAPAAKPAAPTGGGTPRMRRRAVTAKQMY